jgi:hypothetical protein
MRYYKVLQLLGGISWTVVALRREDEEAAGIPTEGGTSRRATSHQKRAVHSNIAPP